MKSDSEFAGSIPEIYDRYLGPLIFEPYAIDLGKRVAALHPKRVLETAAGTGIVTRELARRLGRDAALLATDLNQAMLDVAKSKLAGANIEFRQADALALGFESDTFDAVICQFGAMFFPDKVKAYREAWRVLKPGGRFVFNVWDWIERNEFAEATSDAVARCFPSDPPQFLRRTPYGYHDVEAIKSELKEAGFNTVSAEPVSARSRAPSHEGPAIGFCQGSPLRSEIEARDAQGLARATQAAAEAIALRFGRGPVEAGAQAVVFTAIR
jgi:ubiquinone/menaquinone biosynthesis C-methylase UbiE